MVIRTPLFALLVLTWGLAAAPGSAAQLGRKPNIVVILADDLGYADVGVHGCRDVPTPHVDSLAHNGVRLTDGYATHPGCSPSRAGLMSGRYQHRFGFEHNSGPERYAADNFGLPRSEKSLAERLKELGYATGMVGKWHIGFKPELTPPQRGFDFYFGFLSGAHTYLPDRPDNNPLLLGSQVVEEKEYLTDAFGREAAAFIERSKEGPFFLYLAFNAVHSPLEATQQYEDRFPNVTNPKRRTYAGMLSAMDDAVGRVLGKIREHRLEQDTLVFFYSDNGGPTPQTTSRNDPLRGYKGQVLEGGIRVPFLIQWKGQLPAGKVYEQPVMAFDIHATALAAAGGEPPVDKPLDGVNLIPFLTGDRSDAPHDRLFWRAGEQWAVRMGDWKLVRPRGEEPQLYDLNSDVGEARDLAAKQPAKLRELQAAYDAWDQQMMAPQWIRQDARTARRRGTPAGRFQQLDRNRDGKLTADELPRAELFKRLDRNGDGAVTLDEAKAATGRVRNAAQK